MNTTKLMLSGAIASLMLVNPGSIGEADAGKIKIHTKAVKLPNKVAKPKVRIKVKVAAPKLAKKVKIKRTKLRRNEKIDPQPNITEQPKIAKNNVGTGKDITAESQAGAGNTAASLPETMKVIPQFRIAHLDQSAGKDAAEAARAAEAAMELADLRDLRDLATPDLGLPMPDMARDVPSNAERLGTPDVSGIGGSMVPGDDLGSGPGGISGPANSHNSDTPANPWGVDIAGAMSGVAGRAVTTTHDTGDSLISKTSNTEHGNVTITTANNGGGAAQGHRYQYVDGVIQTAEHTTVDNQGNTMFVYENFNSGWSHWSYNGEEMAPMRLEPGSREHFRRDDQLDQGINQLQNPDYVDGGSNCRDIGCIVRGEGKPKGLEYSKVKDGKTQVFPGPQDDAIVTATGAPAYTANDVLERYDEDNRVGGTRTNLHNLCFHSEC